MAVSTALLATTADILIQLVGWQGVQPSWQRLLYPYSTGTLNPTGEQAQSACCDACILIQVLQTAAEQTLLMRLNAGQFSHVW